MAGGENKAQSYAAELAAKVVGERDGVTVAAGGSSMIIRQINEQTKHDLMRMEAIAIPLSFLVLVWVFGGLIAATLPLLVGMMAILGAMAVLRLITHFTDAFDPQSGDDAPPAAWSDWLLTRHPMPALAGGQAAGLAMA